MLPNIAKAYRPFSDIVDLILSYIGGLCFALPRHARAHNPFSRQGRRQLKITLKRSGPAYHLTEPALNQQKSDGALSGWKLGIALSAVALILCLIVELAMLIIALRADAKRTSTGTTQYDGVMIEGSCETVRRYTTLLSLPINIIATLLIGISNYAMQILSAPSEREVRTAHAKQRSLQLGTTSPANMRFLDGRKTMMWLMMGLTSIPVHLLANSAFFASLQTNNYGIAVVTSDYKQDSLWSNCALQNSTQALPWTNLSCDIWRRSAKYEELSPTECIKRYSSPIIDQFSNVILISNLTSSDRGRRLQEM